MSRTNTIALFFVIAILGQSVGLAGQHRNSGANLPELPIIVSWNDDGLRIRTKNIEANAGNLLNVAASQYFEKIGNDFIQISIETGTKPIVIDMTNYLHPAGTASSTFSLIDAEDRQINIEMERLPIGNYYEENSFVIELQNFSSARRYSRQVVVLKGLDVFYVGADACATLSSDNRTVTVDAHKCEVKQLLLKGGLLNLRDIDHKVPVLCRKYNDRYYSESNAFVCLEDCKGEDPDAATNLKHVRKLITKYNITDFEDEPVSFLDNIILTKKGLGLNLKVQQNNVGLKTKRKGKNVVAFSAYDNYRFFPWHEFINLSFSKYAGEKQLLIRDPYNNSYIYNSQIHFSNVELIQFFNELKALISTQVN